MAVRVAVRVSEGRKDLGVIEGCVLIEVLLGVLVAVRVFVAVGVRVAVRVVVGDLVNVGVRE